MIETNLHDFSWHICATFVAVAGCETLAAVCGARVGVLILQTSLAGVPHSPKPRDRTRHPAGLLSILRRRQLQRYSFALTGLNRDRFALALVCGDKILVCDIVRLIIHREDLILSRI